MTNVLDSAPPEPGMGQCTVTGKWVPEDELVTLHGQRVCAEGKEILLDRLQAGEMPEGQFERPGIARRFLSYILDIIVLLILQTSILFGGFYLKTHHLYNPKDVAMPIVGILQCIEAVISVAYFAMWHSYRGQTFGKIAGHLKVIRMDGSPISKGTAWIRSLAFVGLPLLTGPTLLMAGPLAATVVNLTFSLYLLADGLAICFDYTFRRALHDRIAGTRVVQI